MTIKEGANWIKHHAIVMLDNNIPGSNVVTMSGSFTIRVNMYPTVGIKEISIMSYQTVIAAIDEKHDMYIGYTYKGGTPTTQRVIRAICHVFNIPLEQWKQGNIITLE